MENRWLGRDWKAGRHMKVLPPSGLPVSHMLSVYSFLGSLALGTQLNVEAHAARH